MAMGECLVYSRLQVDSEVKFEAWPTSWQPPDTDRFSRIWLAPYRQHYKYHHGYYYCMMLLRR